MSYKFIGTLSLAASLAVGASTFAFGADDIVVEAPANSSVAFWGGEIGDGDYTIYAGNVTALNGDIGSDGYLLRISGAFGEYEYTTTAVAGGEVDLEGTSVDLMIGYQMVGADYISAIYGGIHYRDNDLNPFDATNPTSGGETGAKVQFEATTTSEGPGFVGLLANYSTAYDTYYVRGRLGLKEVGMTIGVEGMLLGDESYDGYKVGGFIGGVDLGGYNMSLNAGYQSSEGNTAGATDDSGFYAGVGFSILY